MLFAIGISYLTRPLPDQVFSYVRQSQSDALSGWSVEYLPEDAFLRGAASPEPVRTPLPVRLSIPSINVDAAVQYVGLTSDGAMDTPQDPADVAWFEQGTAPGQVGSAVIAGHYGRRNNTASVFDNLHKLRPGDTVYVQDDSGASVSFVVRTSRRYDPTADARDVFVSQDGKPHLNLVTCEGVWDTALNGYPVRLVVFTDMLSE